jgi:hypothetical protein
MRAAQAAWRERTLLGLFLFLLFRDKCTLDLALYNMSCTIGHGVGHFYHILEAGAKTSLLVSVSRFALSIECSH